MKYIGLDLGSRTLGVAISDETGFLARSYDTFRFTDDDYDSAVKYTIDICNKENVKNVVLGFPKHMNGDNGVRASISEDFKAKIEEQSDIKVFLEDERLTTVIVDRAMISGNVKRKDRHKKKDEMAAVVILQGFLDKKSL
ncbi:MAG: Holliday junction resolvase RuvX [Acholeplasmatales bacterium]|nr:Holliday junction resolvase RuvX [Acholeplasmatales bacterium]